MKVTIKTKFGKMKFKMDQNNAMQLIRQAAEFATKPAETVAAEIATPANSGMVLEGVKANGTTVSAEQPDAEPVDDIPTTPVPTRAWPDPLIKKPVLVQTQNLPVTAPKTRTERMFGAKETWDMPVDENKPEQASDPKMVGFWGALHIKCEACGKTKSFYTKNPVTYQWCDCGHKTELNDLIPVHFKCECGKAITYRTNMDSMMFDINCHNCGAPVTVELNGRGTAFSTVEPR